MLRDLFGKQLLFFDGAMGTLLQKAGLKTGEIPDIWNNTHSDIVKDFHKQYLAAGCDLIKTNTFNACKPEGTGYSAEQIIASAVANAKSAAAEYASLKPRYVALDIGPTGKLLKPLGDLHFEQAVEIFKEAVEAGVKAGADAILIETMSDAYELKAAVLAAKENCGLPVIASVTLNEKGKMLTGGTVEVVVALLEGLGVDVIGFNCGFGAEQLTPYITHALTLSSTPVLFMPNAGLPTFTDGVACYSESPQDFAQALKQNVQSGVWLLGGCCGTTPAHIEALVKNCAGIEVPAIKKKSFTVASSYGKTVSFGSKPVIIGERINPTGKPKLKQALKDGDYDYVMREGILQTEQGAGALDVNSGVPGIDEASVLTALVEQLQGITDIPLQIDTADINAMACAMRIYNGKPIINSVNGKTSIMDAVFPLAKKYGAVIVALTLDENGIPETAQGRIDIAKKILKYACKYGIGSEAFLFDPLTMAVSAGQDNARITLECVRSLKEMGVKTILGVSNVSFGLPCREILNSAFLSLALEAGLDAAILNPNVRSMHDAIENYANGKPLTHNEAADALLGKDEQFKNYIAVYGGQQPEDTAKPKAAADGIPVKQAELEEETLGQAVLKGLRKQATYLAERSLEARAPLEVIEQELIPALNTAGQRFEQGTMYLPQLLMCAEVAKNAFTVIRAAMGSADDKAIGTVVIATVEGDIHDIGKNIVKAMLENYRFNVVDLGKDVPPQAVVEAVKKHNAKLVGLSALMTTTVVSMEETIQALREAAVDCKIMCGGAVLTESYASRIGADCYVKDAMASVRYAQKVFGV